jgi:hypothetical protein
MQTTCSKYPSSTANGQSLNCNYKGKTRLCMFLRFIVVKQLPCGHEVDADCGKPVSDINCDTTIDFTCPYGHKTAIKCFEKGGFYCQVPVEIQLPCDHLASIVEYSILICVGKSQLWKQGCSSTMFLA